MHLFMPSGSAGGASGNGTAQGNVRGDSWHRWVLVGGLETQPGVIKECTLNHIRDPNVV